MYFNWQNEINNEELNKCVEIIKNNGIIVFPTETVYGIGGNAFSSVAIKKIFEAKNRELDNPLIVHIADKDMINNIAKKPNKIEQLLIDNFMPGPFTIILKKKDIIPNNVSANLDTIGVRIPSNIIARTIILKANVPIAAPSANISGKPSGTKIEDIRSELEDKVDVLIDGGFSDIGLESTVVKVENDIPIILRPGKVTLEDIQKIIINAKISENIFKKAEKDIKVESPGMKYKHYAPNTKCVLVCSESEEKQIYKINELIKEEKNIAVIGFLEHKNYINTDKFLTVGKKDNLEEISKNIFTMLRKADTLGCKLIIIEGVKTEKLGLALMNRLIRTAEYNIYNI